MSANPDISSEDNSADILRFGGAGTVLLLSLLTLVALYPLITGGVVARTIGGIVLATILVSGTLAASRSRVHRAISAALAATVLGLHVARLMSGNTIVESFSMVMFSVFCMYTAIIMLRRVLSFGPLYADRVHAALSVYILLAMSWAGAYALVEVLSPGAFSFGALTAEVQAEPRNINILPYMFHFSIATLTSTGYGDIVPIAPFARSLSQTEQLTGVFYVAVLISRLVGLYPEQGKERA